MSFLAWMLYSFFQGFFARLAAVLLGHVLHHHRVIARLDKPHDGALVRAIRLAAAHPRAAPCAVHRRDIIVRADVRRLYAIHRGEVRANVCLGDGLGDTKRRLVGIVRFSRLGEVWHETEDDVR